MPTRPPLQFSPGPATPGRFGSYLHFPVVCCGFLKLFLQLEGDLGGLERALGFDAQVGAIGSDADYRLL